MTTQAKNDDPLVNHPEHNHDFSFAAQIIPTQGLSLDFNYAHDDVLSADGPMLCLHAHGNGAASSRSDQCRNLRAERRTIRSCRPATCYLGNGYYHAPANVLLRRR